ncbi:hypothetical protein AgCh_015327 [Apium graveolens]
MRPTKILLFDSRETRRGVPIRSDAVKPVLKSRLMRQFRVPEKPITGPEAQFSKLKKRLIRSRKHLVKNIATSPPRHLATSPEAKTTRQENRHLA